MLQIAVWDIPPAQLLASSLRETPGVEVHDGPAFTCEQWVQDDRVDAALIPTLAVLRDPDPWEVVPDVGLAGRSYPYARLLLGGGLEQIERVGFNPRDRQEVLLTQIALKEHYQAAPEFVPFQQEEPSAVLQQYGAVLVTDPEEPAPEDGVALDIGREWFELTTYPTTWGLFASKTDRLPLEQVEIIRDRIVRAEAQREEWIASNGPSETAARFIREDLEVHVRGLVERGLEEMSQYLFFHGALEEVSQVPFIIFPEEEEEEPSGE